jgi:SWI/SNF-related matrix-associated actin-dependent regulator of chromatin subfamily A-like protein 1
MTELFKHQIEGIEFLKNYPKSILADEMGLGKTRQAIIAAGQVLNGPKVLIVCPASLKINWQREIEMVYPDAQIGIISTTEDIDYPSQVNWFIINYDIVGKKIDFINWAIDVGLIDTMILDEAHYIKGKSIRATAIIGGIAKRKDGSKFESDGLASRMKRVYCLTGTPLMNRPIELFNLLKAIGHPLGRVRSYYSKRYCGGFLQTIIRRYRPPLRIWNEQGATNLEELRREIKGWLLRRKKDEVLDLPEKIISVMDCELTKEWQITYDNAWEAYIDFLEQNPIPDKNIDNIILARQLVEIQKLKQVCSRAKIDRIISDTENAIEQDEKVIVFSQYTNTIKELAEKLTAGLKSETGKILRKPIKNRTLTGADDMRERQKAVDDFQNDNEVKVFIANIKAGGVGLNLTAASIVIFADMDWSPSTHDQAIGRAHRIGTKKTVNAYFYICPETIEKDIMEVLNLKMNVVDKILEGSQDNIKTQSVQEAFLKRMAKKTAGDN